MDVIIKSEPDIVVKEEPTVVEPNFQKEELILPNEINQSHSSDTANHDELDEFGCLNVQISENKLCRSSDHTGYHVERKNGIMNISVSVDNPHIPGLTQVRCLLVRSDPNFRHFPVEKVCASHRREVSSDMVPHVLQAVPDSDTVYYYDTGFRNSVLFPMQPIKGQLKAKVMLRFMCNDSCRTNESQSFTARESSRDLWLVLTVEQPEVDLVLGRRLVSVWPKAVVRECDLVKTVRRKQKGGAAQNAVKRKYDIFDHPIPPSDYVAAIDKLERLEDELVRHALKSGIEFSSVVTRLRKKFAVARTGLTGSTMEDPLQLNSNSDAPPLAYNLQ